MLVACASDEPSEAIPNPLSPFKKGEKNRFKVPSCFLLSFCRSLRLFLSVFPPFSLAVFLPCSSTLLFRLSDSFRGHCFSPQTQTHTHTYSLNGAQPNCYPSNGLPPLNVTVSLFFLLHPFFVFVCLFVCVSASYDIITKKPGEESLQQPRRRN